MSAKTHDLYMGTRGYIHKSWQGSFFPDNLNQLQQLQTYSSKFNLVEIAELFKTPSHEEVLLWQSIPSDQLHYLIHLPKQISHVKKLINCHKQYEDFISAIQPVNDHIAGLIIALPYLTHNDFGPKSNLADRLHKFLSTVSSEIDWIVDLQNPDLVDQNLLAMLNEHNVSLMLKDNLQLPNKHGITYNNVSHQPLTIIRLEGDRHLTQWLCLRNDLINAGVSSDYLTGYGPNSWPDLHEINNHFNVHWDRWPQPNYSAIVHERNEELQAWATFIANQQSNNHHVHVVITNDFEGCAIESIDKLKQLLGS